MGSWPVPEALAGEVVESRRGGHAMIRLMARLQRYRDELIGPGAGARVVEDDLEGDA